MAVFYQKDKGENEYINQMLKCALFGMIIFNCKKSRLLVVWTWKVLFISQYWMCGWWSFVSIIHNNTESVTSPARRNITLHCSRDRTSSPGHLLTTLFARTLISIFFTTDYSPVFRKVNEMSHAEVWIQYTGPLWNVHMIIMVSTVHKEY